jgi:poly-gamma-glutamate synthesis protein (capsule biosynthesis protein)
MRVDGARRMAWLCLLIMACSAPAMAWRVLLLGDTEGDAIHLAALRAWAREADLVLVNLEGPLTRRSFVRLRKQWHLRSNPSLAAELARLAPRHVVGILANNHAGDGGPLGVDDTRAALRRAGLRSVGDPTWPPREVEALKLVGFERPLFVLAANLVPGEIPRHAWSGRPQWEKRLIEQVRRRAAQGDVIVCLHWNAAEQILPPLEDRRLARALTQAGAKVVAGFHPHVWGAVERPPEGGVILYSVGNCAVSCPCSQEPHGAAVLVSSDPTSARVLPIDCGTRARRLSPSPARGDDARQLLEWINTLSKDFGAHVNEAGGIQPADGSR